MAKIKVVMITSLDVVVSRVTPPASFAATQHRPFSSKKGKSA
jgi:hypothetical protein